MTKDNWIWTYYQKVKNGSVVVGRWVELILEYIVNGLQEKRFFYDQKKANEAIDWIETHAFHTEGPLAPQPLKLELWEKAFVASIYGLVDEKGLRQFREIVLIVARKNGETVNRTTAEMQYKSAIDIAERTAPPNARRNYNGF